MTPNGNNVAAKHLQLKRAVGPATDYLCTAMEIGIMKAFVDWRVFDHIPDDGSSISSAELAKKIGGEQELLERLLPYLVAADILAAPSDGQVTHTATSRLYKSDQVAAGFLTHIHNLFIRSMAQLPAFLAMNGFSSPKSAKKTPFGIATGHPCMDVYEILSADSKLGGEFDSFVGRMSRVFPMHGVYDLSWIQPKLDTAGEMGERPLFVDMGGSNGHAIRDILQDHPWMAAERCAVFDRPTTIAQTKADLDPAIKSVRLVEGSVFEALPSPVRAAYAYQFRRILNDFPDDEVRRAWKAVREAAGTDTRVYIVEELLQSGRSTYGIAQDISLMLLGGKRRDAQMHAELAAEVGFRLERTFPDTYNDCSVLEFVVA